MADGRCPTHSHERWQILKQNCCILGLQAPLAITLHPSSRCTHETCCQNRWLPNISVAFFGMQVHAGARKRHCRFPARLIPHHSPLDPGLLFQSNQHQTWQFKAALHDGRLDRASGCRSVTLSADHQPVVCQPITSLSFSCCSPKTTLSNSGRERKRDVRTPTCLTIP